MKSKLWHALMIHMPPQLRERVATQSLMIAVPTILFAVVVFSVLLTVMAPERSMIPLLVAGSGVAVAGLMAWLGRAGQGATLLIFTLLICIGVGMWLNGGVFAPAFMVSMPLSVLAATIRGSLWGLLIFGVTLLLGAAAMYARSVGWIGPPPPLLPIVQWLCVAILTGVTAGFVIIPISLLLRQNEQLEHRTRQLTRANAELEQFTYVSSHDLKEPLRMVTLYMSLLDRQFGSSLHPEALKYVQFANEGANRLQRMLEDMLNYTRLDRHEIHLTQVPLTEAAAEAISLCRPEIDRESAMVSVMPLPVIHGDHSQLVLLFQNLIGNALKFHSDRPARVDISAEHQPGKWVISVRDNGIGIDPNHWERIFTMFQRLHARGDYSGTGIGLSICRKVVENHGGKIWVESMLGQGSTFIFTFPDAGDHDAGVDSSSESRVS